MRKFQIAVIGASAPNASEYKLAEAVGAGIGKKDWVLLNGGLGGVMEAASKGASEAGGMVVGILPTGKADDANKYVSVPIVTNMGHARNVIIVQSADACVAIGRGLGTLSEISIALKEGKRVVGLGTWEIDGVVHAASAEKAISILKKYLSDKR